MKRILLFLMMLTINIVSFAQNSEPEKAKPMTDTEIVRKCAFLDVEGKYYDNVIVTRTIEDWEYRVLDKVPTPQTPKKAYTLEEKRKEHGNAYLPWEKVADDILINFYNEGKTIKEIAEIMERSKGAIQSRLKKLGIIY